ncbi:hypothetical protein HGA91_03940 [candidate division WWE3 bacterium]|nr:hypothetical protein [candidate division WWE3 bacterium]
MITDASSSRLCLATRMEEDEPASIWIPRKLMLELRLDLLILYHSSIAFSKAQMSALRQVKHGQVIYLDGAIPITPQETRRLQIVWRHVRDAEILWQKTFRMVERQIINPSSMDATSEEIEYHTFRYLSMGAVKLRRAKARLNRVIRTLESGRLSATQVRNIRKHDFQVALWIAYLQAGCDQ